MQIETASALFGRSSHKAPEDPPALRAVVTTTCPVRVGANASCLLVADPLEGSPGRNRRGCLVPTPIEGLPSSDLG